MSSKNIGFTISADNGIDISLAPARSMGISIKDAIRGKDGFSPTIEIEEVEEGNKIIVTDKIGSREFTVLNGKDWTPTAEEFDLIFDTVAERISPTIDRVISSMFSSITTDEVGDIIGREEIS